MGGQPTKINHRINKKISNQIEFSGKDITEFTKEETSTEAMTDKQNFANNNLIKVYTIIFICFCNIFLKRIIFSLIKGIP